MHLARIAPRQEFGAAAMPDFSADYTVQPLNRDEKGGRQGCGLERILDQA
jgi:hypothetical protein